MLALLAGCGDDSQTPRDAAVDAYVPDTNTALTEVALIPGTDNRQIDLLFVIDDSATMLDKQTNLKNSFPAFASSLATGTGLPDLHLGVITTDMGVYGADDTMPGTPIGSAGNGGCIDYGKDGTLQTFSSSLVTGKFIVDSNGTRNYSGTLAEAFSSIASAGAQGCGFEQPLHAMQRSFVQSANAGFIRSAARLGIIILTDEDDCSVKQSSMYSADTSQLGPINSFRCTRFGVQCDVAGTTPDEMNELGAKDGCHSNEQNEYMTDIGRYRTLLTGLKPDPRDVLFSVIAGNVTPVEVEDRLPPGGGTPQRALKRSCMYPGATSEEVADPAVRLATLANELPNGAFTSVCNPNLSTVMTELAYRIKTLAGEPCITQPIAQPTSCEAWDVSASGTEQWVPECTDTSGSPCFTIMADTATCPVAQNLKVTVFRAFPAGPDTWTSVRCAL